LGWHLEEKHVTWAHLEKKRTRLQTYTKSLEELLFTKRGDDVTAITRCRRNLSSDDVRDLMTTSERCRLKRSPRRFKINMIIRCAREVPDIVLIITPLYELEFRRFKSPHVQNEKIYNLVKDDDIMASGFSPMASRFPT
ncbi:hypothetical protein Tco_1119149, partial [Tanacetum coccineum]